MATRKKEFSFKLKSQDLIAIVSALHANENTKQNTPKNVLTFFGDKMTPKEKDDFIVLSVKTIICEMANLTIKPLQLPDATKMSRFGFTGIQNQRLAQRFTEVARVFNPNALITRNEVEACETVGACVDLVRSKS